MRTRETKSDLRASYSRNRRLNTVTILGTLTPAFFLATLPFCTTSIPWWFKILGPGGALLLLLQLKSLFGNWDLWAEVFPSEIIWGRQGLEKRVDLHGIAELYIEEPRKYRLVSVTGASEVVDLRVLYHASGNLDTLVAELMTAQLLPRVMQSLATVGTCHFGPITIAWGDTPSVNVVDFEVPLLEADLVFGKLLVTVANAVSKQVRVVPRHAIPNIHTLAMSIYLLQQHSLSELIQEFPIHPSPTETDANRQGGV